MTAASTDGAASCRPSCSTRPRRDVIRTKTVTTLAAHRSPEALLTNRPVQFCRALLQMTFDIVGKRFFFCRVLLCRRFRRSRLGAG